MAILKFFSLEPMHGISFHCACTNCICIEVKRRISSKENNTLTEKGLFSLIYPLFTWFMVLILKRHVCERMFELTEICTLLKKGADPKETILLLNSSVTWCHFRENDIPTHPPINSILPISASLDQLPRHCNEKNGDKIWTNQHPIRTPAHEQNVPNARVKIISYFRNYVFVWNQSATN